MKDKGYVLLRNFIHDRLYHPTMGYFCKPNLQVGEMKGSINFENLIGYSDYIQQLQSKYPQNAWLTPSQIFKPYYGMTVGNYLNQAFKKIKDQGKTKQLRITEVGAGTGAAADGILEYFKNYQPQIYDNLKYTIVEISPNLCQRLETKFKEFHPQLIKRNSLQIRNQDIVNYSDQNHNFILFFEVLDNMPHDRVTYDPELKQYTQQTLAELQTNQEKLQPIKDSLIKQCLEAYKKIHNFEFQQKNYFRRLIQSYQKPKPVFLPTYFLMVLKKMKQRMGDFDLVISDFHSLPSTISGVNAPIVSFKGKSSDQKIDYQTYLINRGDADIFFPTNFNLVNSLYHSITSKQGQIVKSHQFMKQFSISNWTNTKSNYNPLKQDFANTSFFVSKI